MGFLDKVFGSGKNSFTKHLQEFTNTKIKDLMSTEVHVVSQDESLIDAANIMIGEHVSGLVVVELDTRKPLGIITERDYIKQAPKKAEDLMNTTVGDLMTKELITVQPGLSIMDAGQIMDKHKFRKLVVTEGDKLAGIITQTDLVRKMDEFYQKYRFKTSDNLSLKSIKEDALTLDVTETISDAHKELMKDETGSAFIVKDGKLKGTFTEFDFLSQVALNPEEIYDFKLGDVMSFPLVAVDEEVDLFDANHLMVEKDFRRLPVFEKGELVGKVTQTGLRKSGFNLLATTLKRAKDGKLADVNFELLKKSKPLVREIHDKVQEFVYPQN